MPLSRGQSEEHLTWFQELMELGRETLKPSFVLVSDPVLAGLGHRVHAEKVRPAVRGKSQVTREDAHRQARERDLECRAIGFDAA